MSDWEFLLQKEGDQTWLPLESADVEILEGRYRIVANTHIANTEVQIRIIHYSTEENPPVKRVQKRSSHTHSQGLIAIIPFTRLKPGKWEFRCQAKATTSLATSKQYIVHLEVLPIEYEVSDYTQQLDPETQTEYLLPDSQQQQNTDLITDQNTLIFSEQLNIDELEIKGEENIEQNIADSAQVSQAKVEEIKLFDSLNQDRLAETENIVDLPRVDAQTQTNIFSQNQLEKLTHISTESNIMQAETQVSKENPENELIENQKIELPKIPENQLTVKAKINQETETETKPGEETKTDAIAEDRLPLQLTLDQASYIAQPGEALIVSGQVMPEMTTEPSKPVAGFNKIYQTHSTKTNDVAINYPPIVNGNLQICLRNPQTSEVLIDIQQALPEQEPPIIFACAIQVPENIKSRLVLGQITLTDRTGILVSKSFTITAPLQEWLGVIDDNFVEDQHQTATLESTKPDRQPPSFQDLVAKISQTHSQQKSDVDRPLPPQIYQPIVGSGDSESLELPAFGNPMPENVTKDVPKINELLAKSESPPDLDQKELNQEKLDENELDDLWEDADSPPEQTKLQAETTDSESEITVNEETPEIKQNLVPFPTKFSPKKKAFKALKLEDRFFSRLNSLINDSELSQWMKASSSPSPTTEETETSTDLEKLPESTKRQAEAKGLNDNDNDPMSTIADDAEFADENFAGDIDWEAQEFVVEDELHEQLSPNQDQKWSSGLANMPRQPEESIDTQPYVLPDEQPLPIPLIEVLAKDVIAGRQVKVRVQLPDSLPRIYVKIWVYDRQAQAIVAGPRWLTDFIPNGMGQLEVIADLEIAYGCLEITFEAIAVEMQTNRESHKAVVERLVISPPPPTLPFDNLS